MKNNVYYDILKVKARTDEQAFKKILLKIKLIMTLLYSVTQELEWAAKELELLNKSSSSEDFSRYWSNYLDHLNKFWNKSQKICKSIKGFPKIESEVNRKRTKDPLLSYLLQARNAEHSWR